MQHCRGLVNLGNWCFFNCILQALSSIQPFVAYLENIAALDSGTVKHCPTCAELLTCLKALRPALGSRAAADISIPHNPSSLLTLLAQHNAEYRGRDEQDAQELFHFLLKALDKETAAMLKGHRDGSVGLQALLGTGLVMLGASTSTVPGPSGSAPQPAGVFSLPVGLKPTHPVGQRRRGRGRGGDGDGDGVLVASSTQPDPAYLRLAAFKRACSTPFDGLVASHTWCEACGSRRVVGHTKFIDLSLSVTPSTSASRAAALAAGTGTGTKARGPCTLESCLLEYVAGEVLQEVECEHCCGAYLLGRIEEILKQPESSEWPVPVRVELRRVHRTVAWWQSSGLCAYSGHDAFHSWEDRVNKEILLKYYYGEGENEDESEEEEDEEGSTEGAKPAVLISDRSIRRSVLRIVESVANSVRQDTYRQLVLSRLPPLLCVHLKRRVLNGITGQMVKLTHHVDFPLQLDMAPFVLPREVDAPPGAAHKGGRRKGHSGGQVQVPGKYHLRAVVVHTGSADEGHYVTYALVGDHPDGSSHSPLPAPASTSASHGTESWWLFSDTMVRAATEKEVLASQAYLLYYARQTPGKAS